MTDTQREQLFKRMADIYVNRDGEALLRENEQLRRQGVRYLTPRADKQAKLLSGGKPRRISKGALSAIAAGIAIMLLVPSVLVLSGRWPGMERNTAMSSEAAAEAPPTASLAPQMAANEGMETAPAASAAPNEGAGGTDALLMPLPFTLPENFTIAATRVDNGQSVYYLTDAMQDDVVLMMRPLDAPQDESIYDGLTAFDINGKMAYGISTGDFSALMLEKDGILYTLTCRHDINTLLALCRAI